jgi:hypothetical protein
MIAGATGNLAIGDPLPAAMCFGAALVSLLGLAGR